MTQKVNPSPVRPVEAFKTAGAISQSGGSGDGYIASETSPTEISTQDGDIDETALNGFSESSTTSSFDVTIDAGEAFIYGSWLAKDTSTTVTLSSSTTGQTVYVGWNKNGTDDVIIGLAPAFATASDDTDKKIPLFDFDTDGSGVTNVTDRRLIGKPTTTTEDGTLEANFGIDTFDDITDGSQVIWDESVQEIPDSAMGSIDNTTLTNDSVTINANDGLKSGGSVALGSSVGLDIEPSDFAGTFLSDDGSDNLEVLLGRGVENDGSGNISFDEDVAYTFTSDQSLDDNVRQLFGTDSDFSIQFNNTSDELEIIDEINNTVKMTFDKAGDVFVPNGDLSVTGGDIRDGTNTIWDTSTNEIPDSALGSIDNATLTNDTVTISTGDGLKNGGGVSLGGTTTLDVEPADFAGGFLSDDGNDDLAVNIGRGLEDDGTGSIRFDEDLDATWTNTQTFNGGVTLGSNIDASSNTITNLPEPTASDEVATKSYTDGVAQGLNLKDSVAVSDHDQQIDLTSTTDPNPLDGYTLSDGERVLLKHQNDATKNGIYVAEVATDPSTWVRAPDMDEDSEATEGAFTFIENGDTHADTAYIITTPDPISLGTTAIEWSQFSSAGELSAGDGLNKSGSTFSVVSSDLTGPFLSADGNNNLQANIGRGLESDGSDNIRVDEDTSFTFTTEQSFNAGLDTQGDISDGTQTIWDASAQEIPDSAMGTIANATLASIDNSALTNSSVSVTAGDGIKGGGSVSLGSSTTVNIEPADFAGTFLSDDGSDNLAVNIGRGVENDGNGNIRVDEDTDFTFTSTIDFSAGLDTQGDISDGTQTIWDASAQEIPDSSLGSIANSTLTNSSVSIEGNTVSLGGSTSINHNDLSTISVDDHHNRIQFSDGGNAVLTQPTDVNFGTALTVSDDADGTITIDGSEGITDHGNLSGLSDDDHTQYLLADGTRSMSGSLDLGTNNITNTGTITASDVDASSELGSPVYSDLASLPTADQGAIAYVQSEGTLYVQKD